MIKNHIISERSDDGLSSYAFISISKIFKKIDFFWGGGEALRPPPLKNESQFRRDQMGWNLEHMSGLTWGECGKIFSSILRCLTEIWSKQGSKSCLFRLQDFSVGFRKIYKYFFLFERASKTAGAMRLLFFKLSSNKRRKKLTSSFTEKSVKKWRSNN